MVMDFAVEQTHARLQYLVLIIYLVFMIFIMFHYKENILLT
jgi:hypothetical protein